MVIVVTGRPRARGVQLWSSCNPE